MKKRSTKTVSPAVKTYVKRAIHTNQENKVWIDYAINQTIPTASANTPVNRNLIPKLTQGAGSSNRIGNTIRIRSAFIRGHVNLLPYNANFNPTVGPVLVKMWLLRSKTVNTSDLGGTQMTSFFETNNGTTGFQANMLDMLLTENKEFFTVLKTKKFELGATSSTSVASALPLNLDNSKYTMPFYFSYGKYLKKLTRYNDAADACVNNNLFICWQAIYADGSSLAFNAAEFHYTIRVEYEDA